MHSDEEVSGDTGVIKQLGDELFIALVDGLGHGSEAHIAAAGAAKYLDGARLKNSLIDIMQGLHKHLKGTRCAVVALCRLNQRTGMLNYVGVGNISVKIYAPKPIRFVPREGIVGYIISTLREETLVLSEGAILVLHSDGLPAHLDFSEVVSRQGSSARDIAETLVSEFGKKDDDASCIVVKV
ncbi:SpoIIE family protein phosphatase [Marinobacter caseinilyticus]|uniref:SpoIIE family protein phosphatase n=1 Tax=Marinobacter caseinilyticus TaxID=2692195 RepID=UPI00140B0C5B|nr:SpoIIE family protein phosphatase [Marinobacter caseinilyticus]